MMRLALAWLAGALAGALVAAGISLLAFAYPVRTEVSNFPLDEKGNIPVAGTIRTVIATEAAIPLETAPLELAAWPEGQGFYCVCSQPPTDAAALSNPPRGQ